MTNVYTIMTICKKNVWHMFKFRRWYFGCVWNNYADDNNKKIFNLKKNMQFVFSFDNFFIQINDYN